MGTAILRFLSRARVDGVSHYVASVSYRGKTSSVESCSRPPPTACQWNVTVDHVIVFQYPQVHTATAEPNKYDKRMVRRGLRK
jgi:hypothetical protein